MTPPLFSSDPTPERAWLAVVSAEHAEHAAEGGWIQLNDGKRGNVNRLRRGDGFAIYSPTQRRGDKKPLRAVTQIGFVTDDEPYLAEPMNMGPKGIIQPWRRTIGFFRDAVPASVADLPLELTRERSWGYSLRFGLVALAPGDFTLLHRAMTNTNTLLEPPA